MSPDDTSGNDTARNAEARREARPLSPHLGVYRWQITSTLSIAHRLTGAGLCLGLAVLGLWLLAAGLGEGPYRIAEAVLLSWFGLFACFAFTLAFYYHLCNGVRHLFWDAGRGFELAALARSGWVVLGLSLLLTLATWGFALARHI